MNVHLKDYKHSNAVLLNFVGPSVEHCKRQKMITNWHFFREPEIRLRFYGEANEIAETKQELDTRLIELEKHQPDVYVKHVFGAHGVAGKEYERELDFYRKEWPIAMRYFEYGAETTLRLLSAGKAAALPPQYAKAQPKRLRFAIFTQFGRVIQHAGQTLLRPSAEGFSVATPYR